MLPLTERSRLVSAPLISNTLPGRSATCHHMVGMIAERCAIITWSVRLIAFVLGRLHRDTTHQGIQASRRRRDALVRLLRGQDRRLLRALLLGLLLELRTLHKPCLTCVSNDMTAHLTLKKSRA